MSDVRRYLRTEAVARKLEAAREAEQQGVRRVDATIDGTVILLEAYLDLARLRDEPAFDAMVERVLLLGKSMKGDDATAYQRLYRLLTGKDHPDYPLAGVSHLRRIK